MMMQLPFGAPLSVALHPQDLAGGAKSSLWASIQDVNGMMHILVYIGAGTASQNITVNLRQATTSAGGSAKTLNIKEVYFKRGDATFQPSTANVRDKFVKSALASREASIASYDSTADRVASTNHLFLDIRVSPSDLDTVNGFEYVQVQFTSPAAAQLACAFFAFDSRAYQGLSAPSPLA
jgi:hypothetical protein